MLVAREHDDGLVLKNPRKQLKFGAVKTSFLFLGTSESNSKIINQTSD